MNQSTSRIRPPEQTSRSSGEGFTGPFASPPRLFCQSRPFFTHTTVPRRSRRISSRSALLNPSTRRPSSRSDCATQLRIAWAVGSNCLPSADNNTAIHEPALPESVRCEPTRPSGAGRPAEPAPVETGGGLDFGMVDTSSPKGQVSTKSGQLHPSASAEAHTRTAPDSDSNTWIRRRRVNANNRPESMTDPCSTGVGGPLDITVAMRKPVVLRSVVPGSGSDEDQVPAHALRW